MVYFTVPHPRKQHTMPRSDVELLAHMCEGYLINAFFLPLIPPLLFNLAVRENTPIPGISLAPGITGLVRMVVAIPLSFLGHFKHIEGSRTNYGVQGCEPSESPLKIQAVLNLSTDNSREAPEFSW